MIYLIDEPQLEASHSHSLIEIVKQHTDTEIALLELPVQRTISNLLKLVRELLTKVEVSDVVLVPWVVSGDYRIDNAFDSLSEFCWVVVAAGNFSSQVEKYSPARAKNVITVGCLNKHGNIASLSNTSSNKELVWAPGTNYHVNGRPHNGTSVSAALYAAFLAEAVKHRDMKILETRLEELKTKLYNEITGKHK